MNRQVVIVVAMIRCKIITIIKTHFQHVQVKVIIGLKQTNRDWLETTLHEVSDPSSSKYGQYMSLEEITKMVHGHPDSVAELNQVFGYHGIQPDYTLGRGFAVVQLPVGVAERIFAAKFYKFQHKVVKGATLLRSLSYSLPVSLVPHVSFVSGIAGNFPKLLKNRPPGSRNSSPRGSVSNDTGDITPSVIEKSYNISGYISTNGSNSQAVASFLGQYFSPEDLKDFQKENEIPPNPVSKVIGTNDQSNQGIEANLDVQYITGVGRNVDTWFVSVSQLANGGQEDFLTWVLELVNNTGTPLVHSVSYGDLESSVDVSFMERVDQEFIKLGISGRTLLFASGDGGATCSLLKGGRFQPSWPASSPYVTTVGGTVSMTESWDHSGGGFSNVYPTPSYQSEAVSTYLKSGVAPSDKYFNSSGRAYPDISAFSINYLIVYIGVPWPVDGTSCATPTTAGIMSLLNDVRLNAGKPSLGFINPLLYKLQGKGFFDITKV